MSTLLEIENAVNSLQPAEQARLLSWLRVKVADPAKQGSALTSRQEWLDKLAELRRLGRTGHPGSPLQQVMDEMRGQ